MISLQKAVSDSIFIITDSINKLYPLETQVSKLSDVKINIAFISRKFSELTHTELDENDLLSIPAILLDNTTQLISVNESLDSVLKQKRVIVPFTIKKPSFNSGVLIDTYQSFAQYIKVLLNKFEVESYELTNKLNNDPCNNFTPEEKTKTNDIIQNFISLKSQSEMLQNYYSSYPTPNDYLDQYFKKMNDFSDSLFKVFMGIKKVLNKDKVYLVPTPTNMKNFDLVRVQVNKYDNQNKKLEPQKYDYDIYIKGGLKIDFSAGVFGTFLKNSEYRLIDSIDAKTDSVNGNFKMIQTVNSGKATIGFGAMANITIRSGASWFAPGISFGFITDTKPSLQFLTSATLSIGKSERFLLHAGYAFGFVKTNDYLPKDKYIPTIRVGSEVPTNDRFRAKPFFGITYNLSKNKVFNISSFTTSQQSSDNTPDKAVSELIKPQ